MPDRPVLGDPVPDWRPPPRPERAARSGAYCRLTPLSADRHGADLFAAFAEDQEDDGWRYIPVGPFPERNAFDAFLRDAEASDDPLFYAIQPSDGPDAGRASGIASYLRITPDSGSIEVGFIHFAPRLRGTPAATEAMALMMRWAFEAGYRRYEWKCDALNAASRRAAQRLGLSYEGVFRQATVVKGRNRDTAWYAAIDKEWPALESAFSTWLAPENFDPAGRQRRRLSDLTQPVLVQEG